MDEKKYTPIRTRTLVPDSKLTFDLYISLKTKYIKYVNSNDIIEKDRLDEMVERKIKQLFIHDKDELKYQEFLEESLSSIASKTDLTGASKADILSNVTSSILRSAYDNSKSLFIFNLLQKAAVSLVKNITKSNEILRNFYLMIDDIDTDKTFKVAIATASLSSCFGEEYGMSEEQMAHMSMAAMLSNIAEINYPSDKAHLFQMTEEDMKEEEFEEYKNHPQISYEILKENKSVPPEVLELVSQHEERENDKGYPGLALQLKSEVKILGICNTFSILRIFKSMSAKDSIEYITKNYEDHFDPNLIQKLRSALQKQGISLA